MLRAALFLGAKIPSSFLPQEDQGYLYAVVFSFPMQLRCNAQKMPLEKVKRKAILRRKIPGISGVTTINGFSLLLSGVSNTYNGFFFAHPALKPWSEREAREDMPMQLLYGALTPLFIPGKQDGYAFAFTYSCDSRYQA